MLGGRIHGVGGWEAGKKRQTVPDFLIMYQLYRMMHLGPRRRGQGFRMQGRARYHYMPSLFETQEKETPVVFGGVLSNLDVIGAASISWQSGLDWRDTKHCPRGDWSVGFTKQSRRSWGRYRSGTGWTGWDCARWRIFGSLQMNGSMFGPSKCRGNQGGCEVEEKVQVVQVMYAGSLGLIFAWPCLKMKCGGSLNGKGRAGRQYRSRKKERKELPARRELIRDLRVHRTFLPLSGMPSRLQLCAGLLELRW